MAHKVVLRPAAASDLESIAVYTKQRWGRHQAQRYVAGLRMDIESLANFPLRYPTYRSQQQDFRKLSSGNHLVFYPLDKGTVEIVRVLHERMDIITQMGDI